MLTQKTQGFVNEGQSENGVQMISISIIAGLWLADTDWITITAAVTQWIMDMKMSRRMKPETDTAVTRTPRPRLTVIDH